MAVSIRGQYAVVAACGDTQFGRFVSLGYVDGQDMVLARRYVADDDVRAAWRTPKDVLNGTDWGILEDGQESFDPEAPGVLAAGLGASAVDAAVERVACTATTPSTRTPPCLRSCRTDYCRHEQPPR